MAAIAIAAVAITSSASAAQSAPSMKVAIEPSGQARIEGKVSSVSGNTLMLESWGGNWNIDISSAKFYRGSGDASAVSELKNGDAVAVRGSMNSSTTLGIKATQVRDYSVQMQSNAFVGTVSNISSSSKNFTLTTAAGKTYSVTAATSTKIYVNGKKTLGLFSDIISGMRAQVKGVLNVAQNTISATQIVAGTIRQSLKIHQ